MEKTALILVRVSPYFYTFGPGPSLSGISKILSILVRAGPRFLKIFRSWSGPDPVLVRGSLFKTLNSTVYRQLSFLSTVYFSWLHQLTLSAKIYSSQMAQFV